MQGFPFEIRRERKCQSRINCYWLVNIWINIPNVNNERFMWDYGYSGTNFQRPEFQQMIEDCRLGLLDAVIAKDLSRLGREHLQLGWYLEYFFPANNVRVITVTDHYDSARLTEQMLIVGLKNLLNEWYAVDTGYKVRLAKRQQREQGNFIGAKAPYGYRICYRNGKEY